MNAVHEPKTEVKEGIVLDRDEKHVVFDGRSPNESASHESFRNSNSRRPFGVHVRHVKHGGLVAIILAPILLFFSVVFMAFFLVLGTIGSIFRLFLKPHR